MISRLSLILALAFARTVLPDPTNQVNLPRGSAVLRRFAYRGSEEIAQILELVKDHGSDVWQLTSSHIDIYSPPFAPPPAELLSYPHTEKLIPNVPGAQQLPQAYPKNLGWDLASLVNTTYHSSYHPLYEIDMFIQELATLHPGLISVVQLGRSSEGREMIGMKISRSKKDTRLKPKGRKNGFVITGAQHAREWVATASALYLAHALVTQGAEQHSLSHLLDLFDFYIIPSPNPDGYEYTWESDRFWYKNRMILGPDAACVGLDMNRNWGYKWKPHTTTISKPPKAPGYKPPAEPCSHWYPGHRPFQAPEVNNIANYISTLPKLKAFVDLRSYGQMLSAPFSHSCKRTPKDAEDQLEAALGAASALKSVHGTTFVTGRLCSTLYRASGNIVDWMYAKVGIKYSYAVHLRDTGTYGFALPPGLIRPVGEETGKMIEYLARFIAIKY